MPANARLDPFHPVAVGIVGREKALVAWSGSSDGETGVWASFVE
jgi:hypothetical protein